jgi:ketosteroid isomerase-like protein
MRSAQSRSGVDQADAAAFVEDWTAIWRDHDGERWPALLHEDGVLRNPLGEVRRGDLPGYMAGLVASIKEHEIRPLRWGQTEDGVLIEWVMSGVRAGVPFEIRGVDRFTLREGRALEGVAYFDPSPLLQAADTEMKEEQ